MHKLRRTFLKTSALAASAIALPMYVPSRVFGANERILTGHIGVGNQGKGNLKAFKANAIALCDVDENHVATAIQSLESPDVNLEVFSDYRKLLERKDIDAVVITTPDHWHALMTIEACRAGKDVYVEKPLSLTVSEGRRMVDVARETKRIVQTGSQQRSDDKFRRGCELVRSGAIGKVHTVLVGLPGPNYPKKKVPDSDPPANLDYDLWLGPALLRPYNELRVHYNFRFWWDYSGGQMTNFGAHHIDIAHWGLGMDASGPISCEGPATFNKEGLHEVTETCRLTYTYANGVKMIVGQGEKDIPGGTTFIGELGKIHVNRGVLKSEPEEIVMSKSNPEVKLYASNNQHKNFLDCIKTRELPICDVEIGHRSATACHLGNMAARLGRKIEWDPVKEAIVNDDEASAMLSRKYREPWKI